VSSGGGRVFAKPIDDDPLGTLYRVLPRHAEGETAQ